MTGWAPVTDRTKAAIVRALADGDLVAAVATAHDLTASRVLELAKHHGYPDRDRLTWAAEILEAALEAAATVKQAPDAPRADLAALLARGKKSTRAATRRLAEKLKTTAAALTTALDEERADADAAAARAEQEAVARAERDAKEAAVRAEIAEHEKRAAELRASLTGPKSTRRPPSTRAGARAAGVAPSAVRAWAAEHGIECTATGPVPRRVVELYLEGANA